MQIEKGYKFGVYGADSTGEVTNVSGATISYRFDHSPESAWAMDHKNFTKISYPLSA